MVSCKTHVFVEYELFKSNRFYGALDKNIPTKKLNKKKKKKFVFDILN